MEWAGAHLFFPGGGVAVTASQELTGNRAAVSAVDTSATPRCFVHRGLRAALPVGGSDVATGYCAAVRAAAFSL